MAAPGSGDLYDWRRGTRTRAPEDEPAAVEPAHHDGFMDDIVPKHQILGVRRAQGTFAVASDAGALD